MDICCICHEDLESNIYTLPECGHTFHTNCIMTWFRAPNGNNKCPLCNNAGINTIKEVNNQHWSQNNAAILNYPKMRAFSRRKNASKDLKKKVKKLKELEEKNKKRVKDFRDFKNSKQPDLTVTQIHKKFTKFRRGRWGIGRRIRRQKMLIGYQQNIVNIIIPVKQNV